MASFCLLLLRIQRLIVDGDQHRSQCAIGLDIDAGLRTFGRLPVRAKHVVNIRMIRGGDFICYCGSHQFAGRQLGSARVLR